MIVVHTTGVAFDVDEEKRSTGLKIHEIIGLLQELIVNDLGK